MRKRTYPPLWTSMRAKRIETKAVLQALFDVFADHIHYGL